jgi:hypothetical protein
MKRKDLTEPFVGGYIFQPTSAPEAEKPATSENTTKQRKTKEIPQDFSEEEDGDEEHSEGASEDGKRQVLHSCNFRGCDSLFTTLANRKRHERLHYQDKPFECDYEGCGKCFARKYDLKVHYRTHTKEKPYSCTVVGCNKKFSRNSSLREHERNIHHLPSTPRSTRSASPQLFHESPQLPSISPILRDVNHPQEGYPLEQMYQADKILEAPVDTLQNFAWELRTMQRFQQQKLNEIRYHEQRLNMSHIRLAPQLTTMDLPSKSQVNELVTRFQNAQQQGVDFKITNLPMPKPVDFHPRLSLDNTFPATPPMPSISPPLCPPPVHSHVNSLMEDEEKNGPSHVQMWDDLVPQFFPSAHANQTL